MQTERFVQKVVIEIDNLWKIDTYQNCHHAKMTLCAKVMLCKSEL